MKSSPNTKIIIEKHKRETHDLKKTKCLLQAAEQGCLDSCKFLIENKAYVNLQDKNGWSPLYKAVENGHLDCCDLLIKHKADVNLQDKDGWSPLHVAALNEHLDCCDLLIKNKADVNLQINDGEVPLHIAFIFRHLNCFKVLIDNKANINKDYWSKLTMNIDNVECCEYLMKKFIIESKTHPKHYREYNYRECGTHPLAFRSLLSFDFTYVTRENISWIISSQKYDMLFHPLIRQFIFYRWQIFRLLYYVDVIGHLIFQVILTVFLSTLATIKILIQNKHNLKIGITPIPMNASESFKEDDSFILCSKLSWPIFITIIFLFIFELLQITSSLLIYMTQKNEEEEVLDRANIFLEYDRVLYKEEEEEEEEEKKHIIGQLLWILRRRVAFLMEKYILKIENLLDWLTIIGVSIG